jgi:MFS family permease
MLWGVALFGVATVVFGLSTSFLLSLAALAILGAADMVSVYIRHLLVQLETPDEIRGRVSAVSAVFIGASNELGEFESGVTAAWWGLRPAVVVGGVASVAIAGLWARGFPELRRLDRFGPPPG